MILDSVAFTSTTPGNGNISETGSLPGFRLLSASGIPNGTAVGYRIDGGTDWEVGTATVNTTTPWSITRSPMFSSAGGAAVNWPSGSVRTVFLSATANALRFGGIGQIPTAGGTANALTVAHAIPMTVRQVGMSVRFRVAQANTGACTLAVDGTGPANLISAVNFSALTPGSIGPNMYVTAVWDGSNWLIETLPPPAGEIVWVSSTSAPAGTVKANGALLSRTTFARLWAAVAAEAVTDAAWPVNASGRFSQGDGSTTFRVPDLRGEFIRAWDDGRGVDPGRSLGAFQGDEFRSHVHYGSLTSEGDTFGYQGGGNIFFRALRANTEPAGGAETRPRNIALLACVRF